MAQRVQLEVLKLLYDNTKNEPSIPPVAAKEVILQVTHLRFSYNVC